MIVRRRLACRADAGSVFDALFGGRTHAFWLADGVRRSVLGAADDDGRAGDGAPSLIVGDAATPGYALLRAALDARRLDGDGGIAPGWFGWLGYEFGAAAAGAPIADDGSGVPQIALMRASRLVIVDEKAAQLELVWLDGDEEWAARTAERCARLAPRTASEAAAALPIAAEGADGAAGAAPRWRHEAAEYEALVGACRDAIAAGDAYQLCLTDTASSATAPGSRIDPVVAYRAVRRESPTANGGLVIFGGSALVSASPERFLEVEASGRIVTRPIKGTRPRGASIDEDARLARELVSDEKERAENLMIVDLMRNDLGRVAALGSVRVTELLAVESYAQLHQLVSTVEARLAPGLTAVDAVAAAFPAGSMTGAPKLSAMTILHGLEGGPRGVYAGCFGRFGLDGSAVLNMVIRSLVIAPDGASLGAGGGITALSDPARELAEQRLKAELPARVLRAGLRAG